MLNNRGFFTYVKCKSYVALLTRIKGIVVLKRSDLCCWFIGIDVTGIQLALLAVKCLRIIRLLFLAILDYLMD
jgi:hypothetical protein